MPSKAGTVTVTLPPLGVFPTSSDGIAPLASWLLSLPLPPAAVLWAGAGTRLPQTLLLKLPKAAVLLFWESAHLRI